LRREWGEDRKKEERIKKRESGCYGKQIRADSKWDEGEKEKEGKRRGQQIRN